MTDDEISRRGLMKGAAAVGGASVSIGLTGHAILKADTDGKDLPSDMIATSTSQDVDVEVESARTMDAGPLSLFSDNISVTFTVTVRYPGEYWTRLSLVSDGTTIASQDDRQQHMAGETIRSYLVAEAPDADDLDGIVVGAGAVDSATGTMEGEI